MSIMRWAVALGLSTSLVGCGGPTPEAVCKKGVELAAPEMKKLTGKKMSEDDKKDLIEECVKKAKKEKAKNPEAFNCEAKCLMAAKDMDDAKECTEKCEKFKKKGGDEEEDEDKASKKKPASSDDDDDDKGAKKKKKKTDEDE